MQETKKEVTVYFVHKSQNNDGYYAEDDPERDYPQEVDRLRNRLIALSECE